MSKCKAIILTAGIFAQFYYRLEDCADEEELQAYFDIDDEYDTEVLYKIEKEYGITY